MSDMKCPFCGDELLLSSFRMGEKDYQMWNCLSCEFSANRKIWDKIIRTYKALDRAKWWLNEIVENHRYTPISTAEKALAEINNKERGKNDNSNDSEKTKGGVGRTENTGAETV